MGNIDEIVDVAIEIGSLAGSTESFSDMLLVIPPASIAGDYTMQGVVSISSVKAMGSYGYTATDEAYKAVGVALSQSPGITRVFVTPRLNVTIVEGEGQNAQEVTAPESIDQTLDRALRSGESFYGFALVGSTVTNIDISNAATWAEANEKLFYFSWAGQTRPVDISNKYYSIGIYTGGTGVTTTQYYHNIAHMAKCFGYEPGQETWALKTLNGVDPSNLTAAQRATFQSDNTNYYETIAKKDITMGGKVGAGEYIDVIRFRDWLINEIQVETYNYLTASPKVPFNDDGITGVQNVIESVLARGQRVGGIDVDRFTEDGNPDPGYTVSVPKAANLTAAERKSRHLTGVSFTARLAGAIHFVTIRGYLVY